MTECISSHRIASHQLHRITVYRFYDEITGVESETLYASNFSSRIPCPSLSHRPFDIDQGIPDMVCDHLSVVAESGSPISIPSVVVLLEPEHSCSTIPLCFSRTSATIIAGHPSSVYCSFRPHYFEEITKSGQIYEKKKDENGLGRAMTLYTVLREICGSRDEIQSIGRVLPSGVTTMIRRELRNSRMGTTRRHSGYYDNKSRCITTQYQTEYGRQSSPTCI